MDNAIIDNKVDGKRYFYELIQKFDNNNYLPLYPAEKWIICLWLGEYGILISEISNMDSAEVVRMQYKINPVEDQLYKILTQTLLKNKEKIIDNISNSVIKPEDKDFLNLIIKTYNLPVDNKYQETLNNAANSYLEEYPGSNFENYIRNFVRYEYAVKGFSWGVEVFTGAGLSSQEISNYFKNEGIFGTGFIWGINRFQLNTRVILLFSELKQDVTVGSYIWKKGEGVETALPEISLSYDLLKNDRISLTPIAGIAWYLATPTSEDKQKNSELKEIKINSKASPIVGIDFGWEFFKRSNYNYAYRKQIFSYYSCNLRYTFQPVYFSDNYDRMNGLVHSISIGVKFGFGGLKRVY